MKKVIGLLVCVTMVCAFAIGCGDKKKDATKPKADEPASTTPKEK